MVSVSTTYVEIHEASFIYSAPSSSGASHLQVGLHRGSNFWAPHIAEVRTTSETSSRSSFEVMILAGKILPATEWELRCLFGTPIGGTSKCKDMIAINRE